MPPGLQYVYPNSRDQATEARNQPGIMQGFLLSGLLWNMEAEPAMPVCAQGLSSSPHKKPRVCLGIDSPELCHNQNYYVNYSCLQNCSDITTSNLGTRIISYLCFFFRKEFDVLLFTRLLKVTSSSLYYLSISNAYKGKTSPSFIWKGLGSIRKLECPASGNR